MKLEELSEKEQVIECIKALSRIEGIDLIMEYLDRINKELDL